ncbi:hypothetical protein ACFQ36_08895, partial [Arthrobacter sp. GCM10027362]
MESSRPATGHNIDRQLAIVKVARRARGRDIEEIKAMLREEFSRLGLPQQPGTWLEAVASEAWYGKPYVIDLGALEAATALVETSGQPVEQVLAGQAEAAAPLPRPPVPEARRRPPLPQA